MTYGVKVIYTYSIGSSGRKFYEQSILSVKADSFDEAYEKAERYAHSCCFDYKNPAGECVRMDGFELLDCFLTFDEEDDVQELYSCFMRNNTPLDEAAYYAAITDQCGEDEMDSLRNSEFNSKA